MPVRACARADRTCMAAGHGDTESRWGKRHRTGPSSCAKAGSAKPASLVTVQLGYAHKARVTRAGDSLPLPAALRRRPVRRGCCPRPGCRCRWRLASAHGPDAHSLSGTRTHTAHSLPALHVLRADGRHADARRERSGCGLGRRRVGGGAWVRECVARMACGA